MAGNLLFNEGPEGWKNQSHIFEPELLIAALLFPKVWRISSRTPCHSSVLRKTSETDKQNSQFGVFCVWIIFQGLCVRVKGIRHYRITLEITRTSSFKHISYTRVLAIKLFCSFISILLWGVTRVPARFLCVNKKISRHQTSNPCKLQIENL